MADWEKIIQNIDPDKVSPWYIKCFDRLSSSKYSEKDKDTIRFQMKCLDQRMNAISESGISLGRVEIGVMRFFGYRVGETNGKKENFRRQVIIRVITGDIPSFANKKYIAWWGETCSTRRVQAVKDFLRDKIFSPQHKNHERAIQEWKDDLEWLEKESDNILAKWCNK